MKISAKFWIHYSKSTSKHFSSRSIQGNHISFIIYFSFNSKCLSVFVDRNISSSCDTAFSHSSCNNRCMRRHTSSSSKDSLRSDHSDDIFWRSFCPNKNDFFTFFSSIMSSLCSKDNLSNCSSW